MERGFRLLAAGGGRMRASRHDAGTGRLAYLPLMVRCASVAHAQLAKKRHTTYQTCQKPPQENLDCQMIEKILMRQSTPAPHRRDKTEPGFQSGCLE